MKTVTVPFDLELAKKIQKGEVEGKIVDDYKTEYEIIKYDAKGIFPLIGVYFNEETSSSFTRSFTIEGRYSGGCPSHDLQLVIPEYLTWKEEDYLTIHYDGYPHTYIFIYKSFTANVSNPIKYHALFNVENNCLKIESETISEGDILPSTPSEIAQLTDALFKKGKKWNPETKQVEDVKKKPEHEFKPFDRVLGRDYESGTWKADFFSHMASGMFRCISDIWNCCIPYDGNEHLVGTTDNPKEHED